MKNIYQIRKYYVYVFQYVHFSACKNRLFLVIQQLEKIFYDLFCRFLYILSSLDTCFSKEFQALTLCHIRGGNSCQMALARLATAYEFSTSEFMSTVASLKQLGDITHICQQYFSISLIQYVKNNDFAFSYLFSYFGSQFC